MPSLGADMESGTLVEWLKAAGDPVERGDIIAVVETEKGAIEIEIFENGSIEQILVEAGNKVPVGTPLAEIRGDGVADESPCLDASREQPADTPTRREQGIGPQLPRVDAGSIVRASPAARKLAHDQGMDLAAISGTGPDGAIVLGDVEGAPRVPAKRGIDIEAMRRAIAAAMSRAKREIPHYYMTHRIDVTESRLWLDDYNAQRTPADRLLFGALLVKAVALAVRDFPEFNGVWDDEAFVPSKAVHAGVAISIRGGGLVAPAIQDTDKLTLPGLMMQMRDLIGRVRRGSFRASELTSSTITVNSLGDRGVESVLPIIYPPQVAILGFGKIITQPWIVEEQILPRAILHTALAADHRVSDGHRGGLFMNAIADRLASPEAL